MAVRRTFQDIKTDAKNRLMASTPITDFSSTSTAGALIDIASLELERAYNTLDTAFSVLDPTQANGTFLDKLAFFKGITRSGSTTPVDLTTSNFYFFIDPRIGMNITNLVKTVYPDAKRQYRVQLFREGYIDDVDNITYFKIPKGTAVSNVSESATYTTIEDTFIRSDSNEAYVPVISSNTGAFSNVQANELTKHGLSLNSFLKNVALYINCTNRYPITNGSDSMTDVDLRYQISLAGASIGSNEINIRRKLLNIPGVRNITYTRGRYGNGTVEIIVEGISPIVSEGLLRAVEESVNSSLGGGDKSYVYRPEYHGIELNINVFTDVGIEQATVIDPIKNDIVAYINDIPMGDDIIWNRLVDIIMTGPVKDFIVSYFKLGEYDIFNKMNKNQKVLRYANQKQKYNQKWYIDTGMISCCVKVS